MYTHLMILGIDHVDIRYANILLAPVAAPGWPSLRSPFSHTSYRFRIIDFESARKTNRCFAFFENYHERWLSRLLRGLRLGYIFEPWDF